VHPRDRTGRPAGEATKRYPTVTGGTPIG